ncbi:glycosyltransferase family 4 protein [bacterium]|nr:glycosyltransferase family 4 protein [bacterium]
MKILFCHNFYSQRGGEDAVAQKELEMLRQAGHTVVPFLKDSAVIADYSPWKKLCAFLGGFYNWKLAHELSDIIDKEKPDVAQVHNVFPLLSPTIYLVLHVKKVPIVQTVHNFRFFCPNGLLFCYGRPCERKPNQSMLRCVSRRCLRNSKLYTLWYALILRFHYILGTFKKIDCIITLNKFSARLYRHAGFGTVCAKPNGSDATPDPEAKCEGYFLFVGRFSQEKGIMTMLKAVSGLNVPVKMIGNGPLDEEVAAYMKEHPNPNVTFLGYQPPDVCNYYMARALVTVFPSECYENCPVTVIDSLRLGTPVLASRIGGLPALLPPGVGWLFTPGDIEELKERIKDLYARHDELISMREKVAAYGEREFSKEANLARLIEIYNYAISKRNGGNPLLLPGMLDDEL